MSTLRAVGGGLGCALFAGLGAFVGSEIVDAKGDASRNSAVGGAILGSAVGALLIGALTGAGGGGESEAEKRLKLLETVADSGKGLRMP